MNLYLIPGLGADERLFSKLALPGISIHHIHWIKPHPKETLASYAQRLCAQVDVSLPFALGGVSFGGLLAVEMAKILRPEKILVISSIKHQSEISAFGKLLRLLPFYYLAPKALLRKMDIMLKFFFGARKKEELQLLKSMLDKTDKTFINWAIHQIVHWKNRETFREVLHIAGGSDRLMYGVRTRDCIYIPGATHLMIMQEAEEISNMITSFLIKES